MVDLPQLKWLEELGIEADSRSLTNALRQPSSVMNVSEISRRSENDRFEGLRYTWPPTCGAIIHIKGGSLEKVLLGEPLRALCGQQSPSHYLGFGVFNLMSAPAPRRCGSLNAS